MVALLCIIPYHVIHVPRLVNQRNKQLLFSFIYRKKYPFQKRDREL